MAIPLAGALIGLAAAPTLPLGLGFVAGGVVAAIPVALALAGIALLRPAVALLALVEVLLFAGDLLAASALRRTPEPLVTAVVATLVVEAVAVALRRLRPPELLAALLLGYYAAAFIYEVGILLHGLL